MSVIVMGMEMPRTCEECRCSIEVGSDMHCPLFVGDIPQDFGRKADCGFECRPDWCPLRPLPETHGRIVDVGPLEVVAYNTKEHEEDDFDDGAVFILEKLDALPTIVESEGD